MNTLIQKYKNLYKKIQEAFPTKNEYLYISEVENFFNKNASDKQSSSVVLVQRARNHLFWHRILPVAMFFKTHQSMNVHVIDYVQSFKSLGFRGRIYKLLENLRWKSLYSALKPQVVLDYSKISNMYLSEAESIVKNWRSKKDVLGFKYNGIIFGDLIYDTYLRFRAVPTMDINDPFLVRVVCFFLCVHDKSSRHLNEHNVCALVTTYCSYIHHGVVTRLALARKIRVFALGAGDPFIKEVTEDMPSHVRSHHKYKELLLNYTDLEKQLFRKQCKQILESRFKGQIDNSISYMKTSAFASNFSDEEVFWHKQIKENKKRKVLVMLHCFFDSPHAYRKMIYPDFYDWVSNLLQKLLEYPEITVYVKPHPNGLVGNNEVVSYFKKKYPNYTFLNAELSNHIFVNTDLDAAFTVHGTIGHEFPYLGIPVINAGDNPHVDFNFSKHPMNEEDYMKAIEAIFVAAPTRPADETEILDFYFIHSLSVYPGRASSEIQLKYLNGNKSIWYYNNVDFESFMNEGQDKLKGYLEIVSNLTRDVIKSDKEVFNA